MTQESITVDPNNVRLLVETISKSISVLPSMGCDWNQAEFSVAYGYIIHKMFEMNEGKLKKKKATT